MPTPAEKPAATDLPVSDAIKRRWSPMAFSGEPVELRKIATLFEAARWAPSCFNEQPWRYVYATKDDGERRMKLESLLGEGNAWAKEAYLLVIGFAKKTFAKNGKENRFTMHDLGCADGYLVLQAVDLGLISHQMAGFDDKNANALLGVPDDFGPGSMIAVGYPGDPSVLRPEWQTRQSAARSRAEQQTFAFHGTWEA